MTVIPEGVIDWRITLTLKANTRCKIAQNCLVESDGILAETFKTTEGILRAVRFSCATDLSFVPQISTTSIEERDDPNRERLISAALRFEGIFAVFGMIELEFSAEEWAWHYQLPNGEEPKLYFSYSSGSAESPVGGEAMDIDLLSTLTTMSLREEMNSQALTLTLFREGENYFHSCRYIDAVRAFYLSIEHECADGKTGKNQTIDAFRKSKLLKEAFGEARPFVEKFIRRGDISPIIANELFFQQDFENLVVWIYQLRGGLFHQSKRKPEKDKWNPSNHVPYKSAAIIVRAVCASMTYRLTMRNFKQPLAS